MGSDVRLEVILNQSRQIFGKALNVATLFLQLRDKLVERRGLHGLCLHFPPASECLPHGGKALGRLLKDSQRSAHKGRCFARQSVLDAPERQLWSEFLQRCTDEAG